MSQNLNATQQATIRDAVNAGQRIEAIKLYREYAGAGLAEAKDAVERFAAGGPLTGPQDAASLSLAADELAEIQAALFRGEKIEAIKLFRTGRRIGLAEAKVAVEKLEAELREKSPERFTAPVAGKGCLVMLVALGGFLTVLTVLAVLALKH